MRVRAPGVSTLCATLLWCCAAGAQPASAPASTSAAREDPPLRGVLVTVSVGYAAPFGKLLSSPDAPTLSDLVQSWTPLTAEVGYRFSSGLVAGASVAWGHAPAGGALGTYDGLCPPIQPCSSSETTVLAMIRDYPLPSAIANPWLGLGFGWEFLSTSAQGPASASSLFTGPVVLDARLGLDFGSHPVAIGPYFGVALGDYFTRSLSPNPAGLPSGLGGAAHWWVSAGIRVTVGPWNPGG